MRRDEIQIQPSLIDLCLSSLDAMSSAMTAMEKEESFDFDLQKMIDQLENFQEEVPVENGLSGSGECEPETEEADCQNNKIPIRPDESAMKERNADEAELTEPVVRINPPSNIDGDRIIRIPLQKLDQISALVEDLIISKIEMEAHLETVKFLYETSQSFSRKWTKDLTAVKQNRHRTKSTHQDLESFASVTSEINQIRLRTQQLYKQMRESNSRSSLRFLQLQDQVRILHLVPAGTQLKALSRSIREIAQDLGKEIDFEINGSEIELDRPILEGIKDPLMHLLRNAVDHGIENPDDRVRNNKPEAGHIGITIGKTGDRIFITVSDDGRGIDVEEIAKKAVKKRFYTTVEITELSEAELLNLIFRPGFSSKDIITDISGRGVGLDVVLSNIRDLKGNVTVETVLGKGSRFTLDLPLTLSTDHGLIVQLGSTLFAIPISSIERVMEIDKKEIVDLGGNQAIILEKEAIPLRNLAAVLQMEQYDPGEKDKLSLVIVSRGMQRVAFPVTEIISEHEIVIKRMKSPLRSVRNVLGATFMGSGDVIIVLNPNDLVMSAMRLSGSVLSSTYESDAMEKKHILVVDDSITIRTFEKTTLEACGYQVSVAVDGQMAWEMVQESDFDLIVTDIEMPVMNGFDFTGQIKKHEEFKHIPVVIVTSLGSEAEQKRGIEVGADAYIVKNQFESSVLLDVISQLI